MRAILLLLMVTAGCGSKGANQFELDIAVDAPGAASAVVDGKYTLPAVGGVYAQGFASLSAAMSVHGTVATVNSDGSTRATAAYELGAYCSAEMPLVRETLHFAEAVDASGAPTLALDSIECEKADGTGIIVKP
ncbi:MAG TPA: hypothetical protein VHB97_00150 [Polyangia bacterium]|jgi:hypothetical protein|nr:hypothetical protein [Polyangia bacterium]